MVQLNILLLLLSMSLRATAAEPVSAFRRDDGGVTITGENCDFLKRQSSALVSWKNSLKETAKKPTSACTCDSFRCYVDVDTIIPNIVEKYQNVNAGRWGPNCWNTVLVASQILPILRHSPPEEMNFWMDSPLCHQVPDDEILEPGDIAAIRDHNGNEVHASIFVTEELFFSKNSLTTSDSFQLQSSYGIFSFFPVQFSCRHKLGNPLDCVNFVNYYRCSSFSQYIQTQNILLSERYLELEQLILEQEKIVSQITFEWKTNPELQHASTEILHNVQLKIGAIRNEVIARASDITATPDQRLIWSGLKFRTVGVLLSIDWIL